MKSKESEQPEVDLPRLAAPAQRALAFDRNDDDSLEISKFTFLENGFKFTVDFVGKEPCGQVLERAARLIEHPRVRVAAVGRDVIGLADGRDLRRGKGQSEQNATDK